MGLSCGSALLSPVSLFHLMYSAGVAIKYYIILSYLIYIVFFFIVNLKNKVNRNVFFLCKYKKYKLMNKSKKKFKSCFVISIN